MNLQWLKSKYWPFSIDACEQPEPKPKKLEEVLSTILNRNQKLVVDFRFGITGDNPLTLKQCGEIMSLSQSRVRDIQSLALRRLRHPARIKDIILTEEYQEMFLRENPETIWDHSVSLFDDPFFAETPPPKATTKQKKTKKKITRIADVRDCFKSTRKTEPAKPMPNLELVPGWSKVGIYYIHYDAKGDDLYYQMVDGDSFEVENMPGSSLRLPPLITKKVMPKKVFWFAHEQALHEEWKKHFATSAVRIGRNYILLVI